MALLHKPIHNCLFNNIISKWISLHPKSIVQRIGHPTSRFYQSWQFNNLVWFWDSQWYAYPKGKDGRNQNHSDIAIQCCLMIKSLFRLSLCMVTGFVQSLIKLYGLDWTAPNYSTFYRRQKHIDIQISYEKSSNGLHLLVDSTGLKFLGEGNGNVRNIILNIVANGVNSILV